MSITQGMGGPYVEIHNPGDSNYRRVAAFEYNLTWDHTLMTCYYVGNKQGGGVRPDPSESVIEGFYSDYVVTSLYDPEFKYKEFNIC